MNAAPRPIGQHLREWRQRRRLSQLDLALEAEISTRHLSFLETGRTRPSREMVLRLAEQLEVPLRERNTLLLAAGFAPMFQDRALDDPALGAARAAVTTMLDAHEPYPALAVDRHWHMVVANRSVAPLISGAATALLRPPVNVLRLTLHPDGLAPRIANLPEWRAHLLARLRRQVTQTADPALNALFQELQDYPMPDGSTAASADAASVIVPLRLRTEEGVLSLLSTTTVFGTPMDVMVSELAIETFLPADAATRLALRALLGRTGGTS